MLKLGEPDFTLVSLALSGRLPALMAQAKAIARQSDRGLEEVLMRCARMVRGDLLSRSGTYRRISASRQLQHAQGMQYLNPDLHGLLAPYVDAVSGNSLAG